MHWLDIALLLLLGLAVVRGFSSGFVHQLISVGSIILGIILANPASRFLADLFGAEYFSSGSWWSWMLSFLVVVIAARLLFGFFFSGIGKALGVVNKLLGAALSMMVTGIVLSVLLNFYSVLSYQYRWSPIPKDLKVAPYIIELGETILPDRLFIQQELGEEPVEQQDEYEQRNI